MSYKAEVARVLRKRQTSAERLLWDYLRDRKVGGYKFRRQFPIRGCVFDFFCYQKGLAVEADGPIHDRQREHDRNRDLYAGQCGITVLRFANEAIMHNTAAVLNAIDLKLKTLPDYTVPMARLR